MLRLFLVVLFSAFQLFHLGHFRRSNVMYKRELSNEAALCNDGSRAVYYLGVQNPTKWIIFLESGSYCLTKGQCIERYGSKITNVLMTSKYMPNEITGRDLLSTDLNTNRLFNDFTRVLIPYCSSDSWLGTQTKSNASSSQNNNIAKQFLFSGKIIFQSVIFELLSQDFSLAREVVFVGSSAGAIGVLNHIQWLRNLLLTRNTNVKLSAIFDSGWFLNFQESIDSKITEEFYNVGKPLSRACADVTFGFPCCLSAPCMITQGYYPTDVPTLFVFGMFDLYIIGEAVQRFADKIIMAENGANDLLTMVDMYGGAMNQSLLVTNSPNISFFVPACFQHTFFSMSNLREKGGVLHYSRMFTQGNAVFRTSKRPGMWLSMAIKRGNKTVTLHSTLLKWAKARDQAVRVIDSCLGALCNPTCPDKLSFEDTAVHWSEVLNGVIVLMSLVLTVASVVLNMYFMIQSVMLTRAQRRCLEQREYLQISVCEPAERINLAYSSPDAAEHFHCLGNPEGTKQNSTNKEPHVTDEQFAHDYAAKGYNAIFYRTVKYLHMAFRANIQSHGDKKSHASQFDSKTDDFHKEQDDPQRYKGTSNDVSLEHSFKGSFEDLTASLEAMEFNRSDGFHTHGIHNAVLKFNQGEFIGILGKRRAGKTTLLQLLSGRLMCGCKQEHLFVNGEGQEKVRDTYTSNTIHLSQFTLSHYRGLTVRQCLTLSVLMRMPRNVSNAVQRVEQVIDEMKLSAVADKTIDEPNNKSLTKLQTRFICLAMHLVTRPLAIFLDEPIAGLHSASSLEMLNTLRRLSDNGHLVITTMKSLPQKTAQFFNQFVLLNDKQVIFSGEPASLSEHYSHVTGDKSEETKELEDIVSDILQSKDKIETMMVKERFDTIAEKDATNPNNKEKSTATTLQDSKESSGFFTRLFVIDSRASLPCILGQSLYLPIMFTIFGLTAGIVYWQADAPVFIITAYCGASIPSLLFLGSILLNLINKSLEIRQLDSALNVGYPHEHVIHTFTSTSAACILPVLACSALTYFMVMTSYNWWRFFLVTVISLVLNQTWIAVYMMIIYANPSNACHASLVVAILAGFAGGFVVTQQQMPIGYNLLFYINPQLYGFSAITKVLLQNVRLKCNYESTLNCISSDGNAVLAKFAFDSVNPYEHIMIMLCITLSSLLFSWLFFDRRTSR